MTEGDLTGLRELARQASQGPWRVFFGREVFQRVSVAPERFVSVAGCPEKHDAAFIAAANPTTVLALLDMIDSLRAALGDDA